MSTTDHVRHATSLIVFTFLLVQTLAVPASAQPKIINVANEEQLQRAMQQVSSDTTLVLAPGTYRLTTTLYFKGALANVAVRGATGNRDDVILQGPGMRNAEYGKVPFGIWTGDGVHNITVANLTIRDFYFHAIVFNAGTERPRVTNVHLVDIGQQFIKSNPREGGGVDGGTVESSVIEYTTVARDAYTNGVDVHAGRDWTIRGNLFRNITSATGLAGPAVLMWNGAANTVTEGNLFVNCARGIHYGLVDRAGFDHEGGVIRDNIFYRAANQPGDVAIAVFDSPGTEVLNNMVFVSGTHRTPIEYRFAGSRGVTLTNNLLDGIIARKDGASGLERQTRSRATLRMFAEHGCVEKWRRQIPICRVQRFQKPDTITPAWTTWRKISATSPWRPTSSRRWR